MTLKIGTLAANDGMTGAVYDALYTHLKDGFPDENPPPDVCDSWKKIAYAVSQGVIKHLEENLEIIQVKTGGSINAAVSGSTGGGGGDNHTHSIGLNAVQNSIVFSQTGDGTGVVKK